MNLLDQTKELVEDLYRNGSTNNERLLDLLVNLKMIAESTEKDPREGDDFRIFFSQYLTELATLFAPTNASEARGRKELLIMDINNKLVECKEASLKLHDSIINGWEKKIQMEYFSGCEAATTCSLMDLRNRIENLDL